MTWTTVCTLRTIDLLFHHRERPSTDTPQGEPSTGSVAVVVGVVVPNRTHIGMLVTLLTSYLTFAEV